MNFEFLHLQFFSVGIKKKVISLGIRQKKRKIDEARLFLKALQTNQ